MVFHFHLCSFVSKYRMTVKPEVKQRRKLKTFRKLFDWLASKSQWRSPRVCCHSPGCAFAFRSMRGVKLMISHVPSRVVLLVKCSVKRVNKSSEATLINIFLPFLGQKVWFWRQMLCNRSFLFKIKSFSEVWIAIFVHECFRRST